MSLQGEQGDAEQRMLGTVPGEPALGRGPTPRGDHSRHEYDHPAAGWGAARSVAHVLRRAGEPVSGFRALFVMNQEDGGFDCPGCAWPDDPDGLHLDICENGVKHATWELAQRINPVVAGWMHYYGRFYRSALYPLLTRINTYLVQWIRKKYKRLAALKKGLRSMTGAAARYPRLFVHWRWTTSASLTW
jgi:hypothetical protein